MVNVIQSDLCAILKQDKSAPALILDAVIFGHTLFSLPLVVVAVLLESAGHPPAWRFALILVAAVAGRNAANALNRVIDADIDGQNPRTAGRHLPAGLLSKRSLLVFAFALIAAVVVAAAMLGRLCVLLLPAAAVLIGGYSFSKRFTPLCHYWLGLACAAGPMGAFIGLTGHFAARYFALAAAHALWVAGFDIIYALQDIAIDRRDGLCSVPAAVGSGPARAIAACTHAAAAALFFAVPRLWPASLSAPAFYYAAACVALALLVAEHIVALGSGERHIKIASYSINQIIPIILLAGTAASIYY